MLAKFRIRKIWGFLQNFNPWNHIEMHNDDNNRYVTYLLSNHEVDDTPEQFYIAKFAAFMKQEFHEISTSFIAEYVLWNSQKDCKMSQHIGNSIYQCTILNLFLHGIFYNFYFFYFSG